MDLVTVHTRLFFANHCEETFWDLSRRLFSDPTMSPAPYDPVCFDCKLGAPEPRLVQLDHEAILCNSEIRIVREIAPSFIDILKGAVE